MAERRVVITGTGIVNALGLTKDDYLQALLNGQIGIEPIKRFDASGFPSRIGGETPEFKMSAYVPKTHRKMTKLMSHDIALSVVAADGAIRDAGLRTKGTSTNGEIDIEPTRCGVNIGAGQICCDLPELATALSLSKDGDRFSLEHWGREGMQSLTPLWLLKYLPNMLSCHITIIHDFQGPSNSITNADVSGTLAIGEAYKTIAHGKADIMVAGGGENKVNPMNLLRQYFYKQASTKYNDHPKEACRPFDRDADGTVAGDGAGIFILEEYERATKRGASIYAEVVGFGASCCFGKDFLSPEPDGKGIATAMHKALASAEINPDNIDLLIPHGLGIPSADRSEATAIQSVFGDYTSKLPVCATKSRIGNCGAGSSAIDMVTAALALKHGVIPATLNCPHPENGPGLNIVREHREGLTLNYALCTSTTFGGQTAAMVLKKVYPTG